MYTPHSVRLLWASDRLLSETPTPKHTAVTTDVNASGGIRYRNPSKRAVARLRLRLRSEWLRIRPTTHSSELWSHCVQLRQRTSVQCTDFGEAHKVLKMETDSMFLLDINPLVKFLIFEEQKNMCVNEIFEER